MLLDNILNMKTFADFEEVSKQLCSKPNRTEFFKELRARNIVMSSDSIYPVEDLVASGYQTGSIEKMLVATADEAVEDKVLHRLQYLGQFNPGLKSFIFKTLSKACV